jgi:4-hydroxymandelate oxidase
MGTGFQRSVYFLRNYVIVPDTLKSMDNLNTGSTLFGIPLDLPVLTAPISNIKANLHGIFKEEEYNKVLLRGAKKAGTIGCIAQREMESSGDEIEYIIEPINDVYGHGIPFFNPYYGETETLNNIQNAFAAGIKVCGLSLDMKDGRGATLINERWLSDIIEKSPVPVLVKGVLTEANAIQAVNAGAKGIVLSNRGGRVLEYLPSGLEVLEKVKKRVNESALIIVDGGIRNGEDVFKALGLGADLVFIGRPLIISLAGAQEDGVAYYLNKIKEELKEAMLTAGAKTVKDIESRMIEYLPMQ